MENDSDLDKERLANIVESVSGKYSSNLDISLDDSCQQLLLDYLNEVTLAALEQAALLAQHRGSFIVEEEDVQLVLDKKLGIPVPGAIKRAPLYKTSFHAQALKKDSSSKHPTSSGVGESSLDSHRRGTKRKSAH